MVQFGPDCLLFQLPVFYVAVYRMSTLFIPLFETDFTIPFSELLNAEIGDAVTKFWLIFTLCKERKKKCKGWQLGSSVPMA